jgi:hypothetical protein
MDEMCFFSPVGLGKGGYSSDKGRITDKTGKRN